MLIMAIIALSGISLIMDTRIQYGSAATFTLCQRHMYMQQIMLCIWPVSVLKRSLIRIHFFYRKTWVSLQKVDRQLTIFQHC